MIFITNFIVVSSVGIELTVFTARGAGLHWTLGSDLGRRRSQIRFYLRNDGVASALCSH